VADFCHADSMFRLSRKFVAVLLAVWLPLFSGYALADSIVMQNMRGDCHGAQQVAHPSQLDLASHQHMHHAQLAANGDQSAGQHDSQNSPCNNSGVCQLACSGYLASFAIDMAEAQLSAQSFTLSSTQFQSVTTAPLDPPPLARV
jgi:hypothetical protein